MFLRKYKSVRRSSSVRSTERVNARPNEKQDEDVWFNDVENRSHRFTVEFIRETITDRGNVVSFDDGRLLVFYKATQAETNAARKEKKKKKKKKEKKKWGEWRRRSSLKRIEERVRWSAFYFRRLSSRERAWASFFLAGRMIFLAGFATQNRKEGQKCTTVTSHDYRVARRAGYTVTNFTGG